MAIDILVIGATGYTGRLVTRYLIAHRERESFSLGLAARNTSKLTAFVDGLDITPSNSVPIFGVRDIQDKDALEKLFRDNGVKVVLSTVGPYQLYGRAIVEACAGTGVNYVDICGESTFVKDIIISFDYLAAKTGAILVPSGAFDSVPSDLLAYLSARTMGEELSKLLGDGDGGDEDKKLEEVGVRDSHTMISFKGAGASGGTLNSMLTQISNFPRHVLLELERPDCLSPMEVVRTAPSRLVHTFPSFVTSRIPNLKNVVGYNLPLTPFNITIVQRTRGLFGLARYKRSTGNDDEYIKPAYAPDFLYTESFTASNRVSAFFLSVTFAVGLAALLYIPPLRWITRKLVTQPGDGPKDEYVLEILLIIVYFFKLSEIKKY